MLHHFIEIDSMTRRTTLRSEKEKTITFSNVLLALTITLCIICFAVTLVLNFRLLYYFDIDYLNIPQRSGLSVAEIKANYDALISYNSIFFNGMLEFPTLAMSETGRIHFAEVKQIFVGMQILLGVTFVLGVGGALYKCRKQEMGYLKLSAIFTLGLPAVLGALVALNWEKVFVTFHEIFFKNDYWVFSAKTDPVITILPDTFFMHCAILIFLLVALGSLLCFSSYKKGIKKNLR